MQENLIPDAKKNRLLKLIPSETYQMLEPHLSEVFLEQGQILHQPNDVIQHVYFPLDCLLSITVTMNNGTTAETGLVGNRELLGINAFMGGRETTQTEYIVQIAGQAMKMDAKTLRQLFQSSSELRDVLLRYTQAFIAQISQTTACNRLHVLEQRLCRWLLEAQDRVDSSELELTHQFIADMLGVRRAGVSQAAKFLQDSGLIRYKQGHIEILHQEALENSSCECFQVVRDEYDRLLGMKLR